MYHYVETHNADGCRVYTTSEPTRAPCHQDGALKFEERLYLDNFLKGLKGHVELIQKGWHDLFEVDEYAVRALEALAWFEHNDSRSWMPRELKQNTGPYQFEPEKLLKIKDIYENANKTAEALKPQKEWGVFSETLAETIRNGFLRARLRGEEIDPKSVLEKARQTFGRGLKLAPYLKPLYELGYYLFKGEDNAVDGNLFLAGGDDVCLFKEEGVGYLKTFSVDGTTGSVREAVRKLLSGESNGGTPLKYFHSEHPEVFERMKGRDPDLFHRLAVKILFSETED